MNLNFFKLNSYNKIINDYNEFKDIYMFFLYPLVLKLKTKNFKNYNYSIFLKLKKTKQPFPSFKDYNVIKKYTKSNLDKDIKTIIKCIFWSNYIDKSNIYAIYYIKKLLAKNKIDLLYRLLTNAPTKITGGGLVSLISSGTQKIKDTISNASSNAKKAISNVGSNAKTAISNAVINVK